MKLDQPDDFDDDLGIPLLDVTDEQINVGDGLGFIEVTSAPSVDLPNQEVQNPDVSQGSGAAVPPSDSMRDQFDEGDKTNFLAILVTINN